MEFSELKKGKRVVVSMQVEDKKGKVSTGYYTGEIKGLDETEETALVLLDEMGSNGKPQKEDIPMDDIVGFASDEVCPKELTEKGMKKYLLPDEDEAEDVSELTDSDEKSDEKPGKSTGKEKPPADEDEDAGNGLDLSQVPKYAPKKAKIGDRLVVEYYSKAGIPDGYWKATVDGLYDPRTDKKGKEKPGFVGISWDSGGDGDDFKGWIREDHIIGRATEKAFKKRIPPAKLFQHLADKDGKPMEEPPASPFNNNNKERFDSIDSQLAAMTAQIEALTALVKKLKKA